MIKTKFKRLYVFDIASLSTRDLFLYEASSMAQNITKNFQTMFNLDKSVRYVIKAWLQLLALPLAPFALGIVLFYSRRALQESADSVVKEGRHTFIGNWHRSNETVWWVKPEKFTQSYKEL